VIETAKHPAERPASDVVALVRDLMFAGRIRSAARGHDVRVEPLRDPAQLAAHAGGKLIVDLNQPGAIDAAAEWKSRTGGVVIGFVAHTDVDMIARARAAGIDQVLARSAFVDRLDALLKDSR
jgi:hypothetical protein